MSAVDGHGGRLPLHDAEERQPRSSGSAGRRIEPLETLLVIAGLLWVMNTFGGLLMAESNRAGGSREAGNATLQIINLLVYGGGLVFLLRAMPRELPGVLARAWPLLLLTLLPLASVLWSDSPDTSFRRAIALMLTTSFAFYIATSFSLRRFLTLLLYAIAIYIALGILAVGIPRQGITPDGSYVGSWRGFTGIKNEFGRILAIAVALFVVLRVADTPFWRRVWLPGCFVSLALLILSKSKTSLVVAFAAILGALLMRFLFQPRIGKLRTGPDIRAIVAVAAIALGLISVFVLLPAVAEALGRDITLSGRTKLWAWAISLNKDTPWLGHGYRTFWIDANTRYFFEYFYWNASLDGSKSSTYAGPANGHNGYLDVWLEMGYLGLSALLIFMMSVILRIRRAFANGHMNEGYALSALASFMVVYSITERVILQQSEGAWFLLILFYIYSDARTVITQNMLK